jgi:hypothetical protein
MAVNYCGKKFYNIGPWWQKLAIDSSKFARPGRDRKVDQSIKNKITNYEK